MDISPQCVRVEHIGRFSVLYHMFVATHGTVPCVTDSPRVTRGTVLCFVATHGTVPCVTDSPRVTRGTVLCVAGFGVFFPLYHGERKCQSGRKNTPCKASQGVRFMALSGRRFRRSAPGRGDRYRRSSPSRRRDRCRRRRSPCGTADRSRTGS